MPSVSIRIEGLSKAARIPDGLERAQRRMLDRIVERLADELGEATPGGRGGTVGRTWRGQTISSTRGVVYSPHPGAKALARGAYITPRGGRALRFHTGEVRPFARLPRTNYDKRALRKRGRIGREEYTRAFGGDVTDA
jgi:hypothetical protein